jgi:Ca-activated chloride channel family protein
MKVMFEFPAIIEWRQPLWLLALLQPLLLWLWLYWKQRQQQQNFADEHLLPWVQIHNRKTLWQKIFSRNSAYVLAWLLLAVSLAGPREPEQTYQSNNNAVLDVMLVVDVSRSMHASDIKPSRLRRSVLEIYEFLSLAKRTRVGITVYAGRPHLLAPLTTDFKAIKFYLESLDTLQLPTRGSDAVQALSFAKHELIANKAKQKQAIIWMTDGDLNNDQSIRLKNIIQKNIIQGVDTAILALATEEGSAVPLDDGNWLEENGQAVLSKLNKNILETLAKAGNGRFETVKNDDSEWQEIYQQGMLKHSKSTSNEETGQWHELYQWTLFPAILLLMISLFPTALRKNQLNSLIFFILFLGASTAHSPVFADQLSDKNNYQLSIKRGISTYKKQQFRPAKIQFINAVLSAKTKQQRAIALHNLGNSLFQNGDYAHAAEVFTDALRYAPTQQQSISNQKLSVAINIELEKRRQKLLKRGNNSIPNDSSPLFDLPEQIPYMLNTKAVNLLKASLPKLPDADLNRLLAKNIEQFKLLQGGSQKTAQKEKQEYDLEQARIYFMGLEEQQSNQLWKRLFEIEEGFPGKLNKPKNIPGVRPW